MTSPHYADEHVQLWHGDCIPVMAGMPDNSVDAIITDPPYGLANTTSEQVTETITQWVSGDRTYIPAGTGFMGRDWDAFVPPVAVWDQAYRVLKPGGHILVFSGTRTQDLMGLALRLAGFNVRDSVAWLYGSGMAKSHNLKGEWEGFGTALKPAHETILVARKPLAGTVAGNVTRWGTGALNIDATRTGTTVETWPKTRSFTSGISSGYTDGIEKGATQSTGDAPAGRWPANVALDHTQATELDKQSGDRPSGAKSKDATGTTPAGNGLTMGHMMRAANLDYEASAGGASRFFPTFRYEAKAPAHERPTVDGISHSTVKPLKLMEWLARLVTPPGGTILDPFAGSGTTAEAAVHEGFNCVLIEREAEYLPLIKHRLTAPIPVALDLGDL